MELSRSAFNCFMFMGYFVCLFKASRPFSYFLLLPKEHQLFGDALSVRLMSLNILFYDFIEG